MTCPHCRETLRTLRRPDECPHCGRSLVDDEGRALRTVDQDYDGLRAGLDAKSLHRLKQGAIVVAVLAVVGQLVGPFASIPLLICHFIWCRTLVCAPWSRHFGTGRRIVTRWISRFFVVTTATLHGSAAVPLLTIAVSPAVVAGTAGICWWYHRMHLEREHERLPVHVLEKVLLVVAAAVALMAIGALIAVFWFLDALRA